MVGGWYSWSNQFSSRVVGGAASTEGGPQFVARNSRGSGIKLNAAWGDAKPGESARCVNVGNVIEK